MTNRKMSSNNTRTNNTRTNNTRTNNTRTNNTRTNNTRTNNTRTNKNPVYEINTIEPSDKSIKIGGITYKHGFVIDPYDGEGYRNDDKKICLWPKEFKNPVLAYPFGFIANDGSLLPMDYKNDGSIGEIVDSNIAWYHPQEFISDVLPYEDFKSITNLEDKVNNLKKVSKRFNNLYVYHDYDPYEYDESDFMLYGLILDPNNSIQLIVIDPAKNLDSSKKIIYETDSSNFKSHCYNLLLTPVVYENQQILYMINKIKNLPNYLDGYLPYFIGICDKFEINNLKNPRDPKNKKLLDEIIDCYKSIINKNYEKEIIPNNKLKIIELQAKIEEMTKLLIKLQKEQMEKDSKIKNNVDNEILYKMIYIMDNL